MEREFRSRALCIQQSARVNADTMANEVVQHGWRGHLKVCEIEICVYESTIRARVKLDVVSACVCCDREHVMSISWYEREDALSSLREHRCNSPETRYRGRGLGVIGPAAKGRGRTDSKQREQRRCEGELGARLSRPVLAVPLAPSTAALPSDPVPRAPCFTCPACACVPGCGSGRTRSRCHGCGRSASAWP